MISVSSITKSFGRIVSLRDISFTIEKGEIFGLLGPNGAGKSTTVNILSTLVNPDSGNVYIDGINIIDDRDYCKKIMGVVPQEIALYENLTAYDNMMFWGGLYHVPKDELRKNVRHILELVGLTGRKDDKIKTFSGGMKRRINIGCSLLHNPKILVMDEPTTGVDPQSRNHIFDLIENLNAKGLTIIYTTHYMEEAERLCDRIAIIDGGSILAVGTLAELKKLSGTRQMISIRFSGWPGTLADKIKIPGTVISNEYGSNKLLVEYSGSANEISGIIKRIENEGGIIEKINTEGTNLEHIFLKLTGKNLRD